MTHGLNEKPMSRDRLDRASRPAEAPPTRENIPELIQQIRRGLISPGMQVDSTLPGK